MVLTQMYCAEQIIIPELLTNSLKIFAKGKIFHVDFTNGGDGNCNGQTIAWGAEGNGGMMEMGGGMAQIDNFM